LTKNSDNDDLQDRFYLPDLCNSAAILGIVLISELVAIALTLSRQSSWETFFNDLGRTSLLLVWMGLFIAGALCFLRSKINRLKVVDGSAITIGVILLMIIGVSESAYWLGYFYNPKVTGWFPENHWYFLSSNIVTGTILSGLALRYFYVFHQWHRNVENEARTRIHALQARIRPHFLFNSMNTIAALTRSNPAAAESAVEDLADLFRASLADSKKMIRLEQELDITRVYQRMEQQRLGERLIVDWRIKGLEGLPMRARIPSLTLQPLLENAIYHGVEPLPEPGTVEIDGHCKGDMIYISIRNLLPITKFQSEPGNRIALNNIGERLRLALGSRARLSRAIDQTHYQVSVAFPYTE
jgi:two-component system sensor histidine kinase AlgZ